jgi:glycosyltransferase involved in cell wall biosynthesis
MPVLNEAEHLSTALDAIDRQTYPADRLELLIVDGGSTDHTLEFVQQRMKDDSRIRLLGGRGVNTPLAMNLGIEASTGDFIAKIDGHGWIDERFVDTAVTTMLVDETVGCVGGSIVPVAETTAERANAIARFSLLGVGSGIYTAPKRLHETETVQCGVYRRRAIIDAGGFDPSLPYGEDEEANYRVRQAGWKVLFNPGMTFHYRVRPSASALFRQYYRYGHARVAVVRKHPAFFRLKHAIPGFLVAALAMSLPAVALGALRSVAIGLWGGYAAFVVSGGVVLAGSRRFSRPDLIALALAALHIGYGLGSLVGLVGRSGTQKGIATSHRP